MVNSFMCEEAPGGEYDESKKGDKGYCRPFHGLNLINLFQLDQHNQLFQKGI